MEGPLIRLLELLLPYRGRVVGTLAGLALAWLLVTYGFWRTLVILAFGGSSTPCFAISSR